MQMMKGLVSHPNGDLTLDRVPLPRIGGNVYAPRDVLLEVQYCGICGSDIHRWKANKTGVKFPPRKVVSGHEIVGIVAPVDTYKIIVKEIEVIGEISQVPYDWQTAIYLAGTRRVHLRPLVTHQFDLDHWEEAFDLAATSNECLRVAMKP